MFTRGSCRREPRSKRLRREIENWGEIAVGSIIQIAASWCGRPEFEPGSTTNRFAEGAARDQVLAEPLGVLSIGCGRDAPHGWKVARGTDEPSAPQQDRQLVSCLGLFSRVLCRSCLQALKVCVQRLTRIESETVSEVRT